jgi:uncharacterized membrane protein
VSTASITRRDRDNVASMERWASVVAGSGLVWMGLRRRSVPGLGVAALGSALLERGLTGSCRVYRKLGIDTAAPPDLLRIMDVIQVSAPPDEVYAFWRDFENLPLFMRHVESVTPEPDGRSRWVAKFTGGPPVSWQAEVVEDVPGQLLAWRSLPGSDVDNAGTITFTELPGGRGTGVRVDILYRPPAGRLGEPLARLLSPLLREQIHADVRCFKAMIETGEVPTTDGQPSARENGEA